MIKEGVILIRAIALFLAAVIIVAAPYFIKPIMPLGLVTGVSMNPVLKEGDLIMHEKVSPSEVKVGDIIVYSLPPLTQKHYNCPTVVAHRVVEIRDTGIEICYRTKGDNNPYQDPWSVRESDLMGRVGQRMSYLGFSILFFQSRLGLIFLIIMLFISALCLYADELSQGRRKLQMRLSSVIKGNKRVADWEHKR